MISNIDKTESERLNQKLRDIVTGKYQSPAKQRNNFFSTNLNHVQNEDSNLSIVPNGTKDSNGVKHYTLEKNAPAYLPGAEKLFTVRNNIVENQIKSINKQSERNEYYTQKYKDTPKTYEGYMNHAAYVGDDEKRWLEEQAAQYATADDLKKKYNENNAEMVYLSKAQDNLLNKMKEVDEGGIEYGKYANKYGKLQIQRDEIALEQKTLPYKISEQARITAINERNKYYSEKYKDTPKTYEGYMKHAQYVSSDEREWLEKQAEQYATPEDYKKEADKASADYNYLNSIKADVQGNGGVASNKLEDLISEANTNYNKYKSSARKKEYEEKTKDIIEGDARVRSIVQQYYAYQKNSEQRKSDNGEAVRIDLKSGNKYTPEQEQRIVENFNNLANEGYDPKALYTYYDRAMQEQASIENLQKIQQDAMNNPVGASAWSVLDNAVGSVGDAFKYIGAGIAEGVTGEYQWINTYDTAAARVNTVRSTVSDKIGADIGNETAGKVASFLYQTGMSLADFAATLPLNLVPGVGTGLQMVLLSTEAGTAAAKDAYENTGKASNALMTGVAAGIAEAFFEKFSIENLKAFEAVSPDSLKSVLKNAGKQMFTEASEEGLTTIANTMTDCIINGNMSSIALEYQGYIDEGYTKEEATAKCAENFGKQVLLDAAGGAVSGGVLGGTVSGISYAKGKINSNIDMKKSAEEIGKEVMSDENFDINLLLEQAKNSSNEKAENIAKSIEKKMSGNKNYKVNSVDVGNLMKLIGAESLKNTISENTDVKNDGVAANEENINTISKEEITEHIKYNFGNSHKNGITATDNKGKSVVIVGFESSARYYGEADNKVRVIADDGRVYNADSLTFNLPEYQSLINAAKNFDTNGAGTLVQEYGDYVNYKGKESNINNYIDTFTQLYEAGKMGARYNRVAAMKYYGKYIDAIGPQRAMLAVEAGNKDSDLFFNNEEKLARIDRSSNVKANVYVEKSAEETVNLNEGTRLALEKLSEMTGKEIILTADMDENGRIDFRNGKIYIRASLDGNYILPVAMHESMHSFRRESPKDYRLIRNFVVDYLYASGHDVMKMADNVKINYGDRLTTNEDCIEEIVCNSIMAIAGDESAMHKALQVAKADEGVLQKLANAIKNLASKIKEFIITHTTNEAAQAFVNDVKALDKLAEMFSDAADNIKAKSEEVITNEQKNNTGKGVENVKYSIDKHFAEKYDKWDKKSTGFAFRVGSTSRVLRKLGVNNKDITWDSSKIIKIKEKHPEMTDSIIKQVPNILENPIIVMESNTVNGRLVLFGDVYDSKNNPVLVALELNPTDRGGKNLNVIKVASAYGKEKNLQNFINKSKILYVEPNKKRTHMWLRVNRLQLPLLSSSTYGFFNNSISQNSKNVNTKNDESSNDIKYSMGGLKAETADKSALEKAMELEKDGTDSEKIRKETGWFKGYDGKWRFEIDNSELEFKTDIEKNRAAAIELAKMKVKSAELEEKIVNNTATKAEENEYYNLDEKMIEYRKGVKLSDVINHPKLFEAYPQLKNVDVYYEISSVNRGVYSSNGNVIMLNPMHTIDEQKEAIIHEIQHAIQRIEDFANGSNLEYWKNLGYSDEEAMAMYYNTAGEREARDVSARRDYNAEQRKNIRPDIDRKDVVFANSGDPVYSADENIMQNDFEEKVDQIENNTYNSNDVVIMGRTPKVLQDIGFNSLPVAMTKNHIYSVAVSEARAKNEGRYKKNTNYHDLGFNTVKQIYNKISDPLMVIAHPDFTNKESRDSTHKVIALVDLSVNNKQVIAPIVVDFESRYNKKIIDVNLVATYFNKNNIHDLIKEAIALENNNQVGFYYLDKKRTQSIIKQKGYQLPSVLNNLSSNIIIRKIDSNVNKKINKITQSKQFVRWFGDWQNSPKSASKVVDGNGEPLVVYHQTGNDFTVFDTKHTGAGEFDSEMPTGIFMKPTSDNIGLSGNKQMALYANIRNPLTVNNRAELVRFYEQNIDGYKEARDYISSIDSEYKQKYEQAEAEEDAEYSKLWTAREQGKITEDEYQKAIESNALDELEEEWHNKVNEASKEAKSLIDDYFRNSNYDGVIVNNDVGSFGRSTKTYIAFENTQVKSATDNIGTFDGKNPDIRYSIDDTKQEEVDFRKALTREEWASFYSSLNKYNQRDNLKISKNGILIPDEHNTQDYKLVYYNGNYQSPKVLAVYKLKNFDYTIHDNQMDFEELLNELRRSDENDKYAKAILANNTKVFGTVFERYGGHGWVTIDNTRESVSDRRNIKETADGAGTYENSEREVSGGLSEDKISDIRYAIDDTLNDWLDDLPEGIDYEKVVEKNPVVAVAKIYNSASKTAESGLRQSQNVRLEEKDYLRIADKIMDKYGIKGKYNPNYKQELAEQLTGFIEHIGEKGSNFTDVFEELVNDCKGGILLSGEYDTTLMKDEREFVLDLIHDKTLFIRPRDIQQIEEDYGSVANYRKKMFGKTNVAIKTKESGRGYYIEDVIALVEEYYPYLLDENADGDMGYLWLENLVNNVLKPKYKNPYFDGENSFYETPETATVQMAFDCTTEIINQKTSRFKADKRADKKLIRKLETSQKEAVKLATELAATKNKQYRQELKEAKERNTELWKTNSELRQQKNEEHRKRVEHARQMFRKNIKEKQKTREQRNKNAELRKQNEAYRAIVASNYRTIREEYNEGRNKTLYIQKLGRMCDRLTKRLDGKARNNEYIPDSLKGPIVDVLRCFTAKNAKGDTPAVFGEWNRIKEVGDRVADLEREYAKLNSGKNPKLDNQPASFFDITSIHYKADVMERLSELSQKLKGRNIYTLTSDELYAIYDTMQELEESLKDAVQIIVDGKKQNFMALANTAIEEVKNNKSITDYSKMRNVVAAPFKQLGKSYITTHLDPVRYGRMLSNYNDDSIIYKMFSDLHKGENHAIALQHEAISRIKEVTIKYSDEVKKIQNEDVKEFDFRDVETGRRVPITQGVLLAIYLTDRQKSGHIHLLGGTDVSYGNKAKHFTVLPNFELDNMKLKRTAKEHPNKVRFTASDLQNIESYVEKNKVLMELASAISEVYNQTLKQEINEVSMAKYGMKIATVKNYYPLQVYGDAGKYEKVLETESYDTRLKSRGFTKKREWSSTPIVIEDALRKYVKQVREVSEYCGMVIPIENFKKVYNYSDGTQTLHSTIKDRYGVTAEHYIDKLIGDLQQRADTIDNTFLDKIQSNFMGMKIAFNFGSMIKQVSAFPLANRYFGAKNVSLAAMNLFRNKVDFDLYDKYTSYLWYRKEGNGTVVGELSREMSLVNKWQDTFDFVGKMDNRVVASLLYAAELHVEQTTDLKKGTDAFYREVARQFEKCIDETQPNNMVTSKPQYLRNKNLRRLSLNAFRSQNMAIGNTIFDSFFEMKARMADDKINSTAESKATKKAAVLKFVSCCSGAISANLLLGALSLLSSICLYHRWDDLFDDEGNISAKNIGFSYINEVLNGIFGSFAMGDYLYSAVSSVIDIGKTYYGLQVMNVDSINDMVNDLISGKALDALKTLLDCLGIPGTNFARFGSSIYAYYNDVAKGSGRIITDSKGNVVTDYLHYYIVEDKKDGNSSRAEHYENMWKEILIEEKGKTESEATDYIKSKIVTALSADDDIEEAGVAKANGNLADYEKYRQKVIDYGFDSKDVQKAIDRFIKSEAKLVSEIEDNEDRKQELIDNGFNEKGAEFVINKINESKSYDETGSTSVFDDTSEENELVMYSYSDLFDALINGDTENYSMIENYLIEKGGKTKQEIKSAMRSTSRTDKLWGEYIEASTGNDRQRTRELVTQLTRIYGSWENAKTALKKYQNKIK